VYLLVVLIKQLATNILDRIILVDDLLRKSKEIVEHKMKYQSLLKGIASEGTFQ
jgi:hypothetical protein